MSDEDMTAEGFDALLDAGRGVELVTPGDLEVVRHGMTAGGEEVDYSEFYLDD